MFYTAIIKLLKKIGAKVIMEGQKVEVELTDETVAKLKLMFGDDMDLADDVSEDSDLDAALNAERMDPAEAGDMSPEDADLIEQFKELVKRNPSALAQVTEDQPELQRRPGRSAERLPTRPDQRCTAGAQLRRALGRGDAFHHAHLACRRGIPAQRRFCRPPQGPLPSALRPGSARSRRIRRRHFPQPRTCGIPPRLAHACVSIVDSESDTQLLERFQEKSSARRGLFVGCHGQAQRGHAPRIEKHARASGLGTAPVN